MTGHAPPVPPQIVPAAALALVRSDRGSSDQADALLVCAGLQDGDYSASDLAASALRFLAWLLDLLAQAQRTTLAALVEDLPGPLGDMLRAVAAVDERAGWDATKAAALAAVESSGVDADAHAHLAGQLIRSCAEAATLLGAACGRDAESLLREAIGRSTR